LLAVEDGYRESAESRKTLLRDLKRRGMAAPVVAVGGGALGFWAAARKVATNLVRKQAGLNKHR
jgi:transposase-like protein